MKITINHLAKMEGHASFVGEIIKQATVAKACVETEEGARLIEGILVGRHYSEAKIVTSRICGVCPVVHYLCATQAMEHALGIKPRSRDLAIRKLLEASQIVYSHALHLFFLSLPDFLDYDDDLKMAGAYPGETQLAITIRTWAIDLQRIVAGRTIHPLTVTEGGMLRFPEKIALMDLERRATKILAQAMIFAKFFSKLKYPKFTRETEYLALVDEESYAFYSGDLGSNSSAVIPAEKFYHNIHEIERPYQLVKRTHWQGAPFMVGALARLNLNARFLNPRAKIILAKSGVNFPSSNSFHNVLAQAIEIVHFVEEMQKLLKQIIKNYNAWKKAANLPVVVKAGKGLGVIEAPRGTLYHYYELDAEGYITHCNIITPTAQFLANLEADLKVLLPKTLKLSAPERERRIKQLIRAYDPCISCATH